MGWCACCISLPIGACLSILSTGALPAARTRACLLHRPHSDALVSMHARSSRAL